MGLECWLRGGYELCLDGRMGGEVGWLVEIKALRVLNMNLILEFVYKMGEMRCPIARSLMPLRLDGTISHLWG